MRRLFCCIWIGLVLFSWNPAYAETLSKLPNHVYIATFNVYILGAVDDKYKDIEDWNAVVSDVIPERIANLAKVIATGGFHIVAIQEVRSVS